MKYFVVHDIMLYVGLEGKRCRYANIVRIIEWDIFQVFHCERLRLGNLNDVLMQGTNFQRMKCEIIDV